MDGGKFRDTMTAQLRHGDGGGGEDYMKEKMREESNARAMGKARAMDAKICVRWGDGERERDARVVSSYAWRVDLSVVCRDAREMRVDSRLD